jgi:hypothetical protein
MGRPSTFTEELALSICERIAEGQSLRSICRLLDMPAQSTVFKWLTENVKFSEQYAHARVAQAELMADELLDIADDGSNDWMDRYDKEGNVSGRVVDQEAINRSRLRVDTRKWIASKLLPKKYGDKIDHEHSGNVNLTVLTGVPPNG